LLSVISAAAIAQNSSTTMGASAMAMGNAASCLEDEWSLINNVGSLSRVEKTTASFSQYVIPSFKPFGRIAAVLVVPFKYGVTGLSFFRFGDQLYSEQIISIGFSNQLGLASLGLKVNYLQYTAAGFGSRSAFTVSFGGIAEITPSFLVGAHIENINQPKLSNDTGETVPTRFTVGVGFKPSEKVLATLELEKDLPHSPLFKGGISYAVHKKVIARTGVNLNPQSVFGGLGFKTRKFNLDYAIQLHEFLGAAHQASVSICIFKKK
jgi:hypothetical protein